MSDFDIGPRGPLLLGIAGGPRVDWLQPAETLRIRGRDLGEVARRTARARGDHPGCPVVVDIDVVVAEDAAAARALRASEPAGTDADAGTLLYVGTPAGLAGLIADIHVLGIADGVVLIPCAAGVDALIRQTVLPILPNLTDFALPVAESATA